MSDDRDTDHQTQRRSEERAECDLEAKIELGDRLAVACRIKDLSTSGFRLQVEEETHLPDEFDLLIPVIEDTFQRYRARIIWRNDDLLGGEFLPPLAT